MREVEKGQSMTVSQMPSGTSSGGKSRGTFGAPGTISHMASTATA